MSLENGKGATALANGNAQRKANTAAIVGGNGSERNLIRKERRLLGPWNVWDAKKQAPKLGIRLCGLCHDRAGKNWVEGLFVCHECERELERQVA